ncbi:MAG: sel1 repeat family protein [Holosporales bacterium]|jgi:tetratricopeptide (TPR) repeat protein|nr:sel1 repeat family protein [Holosporales bacterium]
MKLGITTLRGIKATSLLGCLAAVFICDTGVVNGADDVPSNHPAYDAILLHRVDHVLLHRVDHVDHVLLHKVDHVLQKLPIQTIMREFDAQNTEFNNALRAHDIAIPLNIYKFNPRAVVSNLLVLDTLFEMQNVDLLKWLVLTEAVAIMNQGDLKLDATVVRQVVEHVDRMGLSFDIMESSNNNDKDIEALFKRANLMATASRVVMDLIQDRRDAPVLRDVAINVNSILDVINACDKRLSELNEDFFVIDGRRIISNKWFLESLAHRLEEALRTKGYSEKRAALVHSIKDNILHPSLREGFRLRRRDLTLSSSTGFGVDSTFIRNLFAGDWGTWGYLGFAFSAIQDNAMADLCLDMAASLGKEVACCEIAHHYQAGYKLPKDLERSMKYSRRALGFAPISALAQYMHGLVLRTMGDYTLAVPYFKEAADQGFAPGEISYAQCLELGEGHRRDLITAAKYYKKAADQRDALGQSQYALCLYCGKGRSQDLPEAAKYFNMAADQGDANGMYWYGMCLLNGDGVPENKAEAERYFRMAAEQDDSALNCE